MKLGLIIMIVSIVWYIIQAVVQAKEREAERQKAIQQRSARGGAASSQPTAATKGDPRSELAERRRLQLEELRQRRAGHAGGASVRVTGSQPMPTPSSTPAARFDMGAMAIQSTDRGSQATRSQQQPTRQSPRQATRQPKQQSGTRAAEAARAEALRRRPTQQDAPLAGVPQPPPGMEVDGKPKVGEIATVPGRGSKAKVSRTKIGRQMHDPQALREAFIIKELLDPPLAMRS